MDIKGIVKDFYKAESSAHDYYHLERVEGISRYIAGHEGGDVNIIVASCYLHDVDRHLERKKGSHVSFEETKNVLTDLLDKAGINNGCRNHILQIISYTSQYSFSANKQAAASVEARIVRDSDNLDALGAIGIARSFVFGGKYNECIWNPAIPFSDKPYESGSHCPSVIHHYYEKLLRLRDDFDTETGRRMANERHELIDNFLKNFFDEWNFAISQNLDAR